MKTKIIFLVYALICIVWLNSAYNVANKQINTVTVYGEVYANALNEYKIITYNPYTRNTKTLTFSSKERYTNGMTYTLKLNKADIKTL